MSDLVTHLRWKGHQQGDSQLLEAADELERLKAVVDECREMAGRSRHISDAENAGMLDLAAENKKLQAVVDAARNLTQAWHEVRLRVALDEAIRALDGEQ